MLSPAASEIAPPAFRKDLLCTLNLRGRGPRLREGAGLADERDRTRRFFSQLELEPRSKLHSAPVARGGRDVAENAIP